MKLTNDQLNAWQVKLVRVVESCKTVDQLRIANDFCMRVINNVFPFSETQGLYLLSFVNPALCIKTFTVNLLQFADDSTR